MTDEDDYNYSKFKTLKTLSWPTGGLEKQLKLRGAKSLTEAVSKQIVDNRELKELKKNLEEAEKGNK